LLVVPQGGRGRSFLPLWQGRAVQLKVAEAAAAAVAVCCCVALPQRIVQGCYGWKKTLFPL
jgi:hypothetical protein